MARLALKLAPATSEFPLKTLVASLLSAIVAFAGVFPYDVGESLRQVTLVVGPLYAFGPLVAIALARLRMYRLARLLVSLLYWTAEGREAPNRLLAQVALQRGDVDRALELIPGEDTLMVAQALSLREEWESLASLSVPLEGDNAYLAEAARIEALLKLDRLEEAESAAERMRSSWEAGAQGPIGYRSLRLSEARIAAERGDLSTVKELLGQSLPGVPAHQLLAVFAHGAYRSGRIEDAGKLYSQAYAVAPEALRDRYARRLRDLGMEAPVAVTNRQTPYVTFALGAVLALAYLGQLWLDANINPIVPTFRAFDASTLAAAFLLGLPGLPAEDAWWRYLSYMFVHGNLIHIGFNVWVLLDIGRVYELRRGWENLLSSFVVGGAMGALITTIAHDGSPLVLVGASGGVLGVAGALLADTLTSRTVADRALSGSLLRWMALIVVLSVAIPNVSLWGHVGGVVGGMLWGFMRQGLPGARAIDSLAAATGLALLLVALYQAILLAGRLA